MGTTPSSYQGHFVPGDAMDDRSPCCSPFAAVVDSIAELFAYRSLDSEAPFLSFRASRLQVGARFSRCVLTKLYSAKEKLQERERVA